MANLSVQCVGIHVPHSNQPPGVRGWLWASTCILPKNALKMISAGLKYQLFLGSMPPDSPTHAAYELLFVQPKALAIKCFSKDEDGMRDNNTGGRRYLQLGGHR